MGDSYKISREKALEMLSDGDEIHTFRDTNMVRIGAEWSKVDILTALDKYGFEITGQIATSEGYGMAFKDEFGWVFVSTKRGQI